MAGMSELSDWGFKTIMINMLRALKDKVDSTDSEVLGKILETENTATEMKNAFVGLLVGWTQVNKDSLTLRISQ